MQHFFSINGNNHAVDIQRTSTDGQFKVKVDGNTIDIVGTLVGKHELTVETGNKRFTIFVANSEKKSFIHVDGKIVEIEIEPEQNRHKRHAGDFHAADTVETPMPGKIVKILVSKGTAVAAKQPLVIVESMKMENEIRSPIAGIVESINFSEGDLVQPGQSIIELKPKAEAT